VVPSGWFGQNSLTFNGTQWTGVYTSDQTHQLAVDSNRNVTSLLKSSGNGLSIQSTGDYMFPTNAILVVYLKDTLSSLSLSSGGALSPAFASGTTSYTASVPNSVTSETVTAVASSVYASVYMNGNLGGSLILPLNVGSNSVSISVYDQPNNASNPYTLTITREASSGGGGGGGAVVSYTPAVQTEAASSITATSAVLNGDVTSDNGYAVTDYGFLWGTSSSSLTNKLDVGTSNISGAFTDTLGSLTAGTTYYFEAYATNSQGTADGAVMSLTAGVQTPTTPTSSVFSDVPASYWGYNAITSLSTQGIVSGYPDGTFKPNADITRAEFAAMLVKALGLSTTGTTGQFTDVTADSWYYGSVNAAASASLISGTGNNLFAPNTLITRQEMAVMVAKALGTKAPATSGTELNAFSDSSTVSSWAVTGVEETIKAGIVSGMTADTLAPMANATRAQAAAMIYHLLVFLGK
jgi:hypothetical protein